MGNRIVVLPKAVDQIIGELWNCCDRLCRTVDRGGRAGGVHDGKRCQGERALAIPFFGGRCPNSRKSDRQRYAVLKTERSVADVIGHQRIKFFRQPSHSPDRSIGGDQGPTSQRSIPSCVPSTLAML